MASSRIASRYSKSLLDLAKTGGQLDHVKNDMETVHTLCAGSKDLRNLLKNPIVKADQKKAALNKIFADCTETTRKFIDLLVDKRREAELAMVAEQFIDAYDHLKGIARATVISAVPLSDEMMTKLRSYIKGMITADEIELTNEVDASIIGGLVVKHEDKLLDMSVAKELREIRKELIYN